MDVGKWGDEVSHAGRGVLRRIGMVMLAACCGAATYQAVVSAYDWRRSDEAARAVLASPRASDEQIRDAIFVLLRHERDTADAIKRLAQRADQVGEHARNAISVGQESWR